MLFSQAKNPELSTIQAYSAGDHHAQSRVGSQTYEVETISLNDLLEQSGTPTAFDYLSVDTEGSELLILQNLDFTKYRPRIATIEHNNSTEGRRALRQLMAKSGYVQVFESLSLWDSWFVLREIADEVVPH